MTKITDLHKDFLLQIFTNCNLETLVQLSDTCKLFREIIDREIFRKLRKCTIRIHNESDRTIMFKIPRHIGQYVNEFDIEIWDDDDSFLDAYFKMLGCHIGSNVRKLNLNGFCLKQTLIEPIKPVLARLTDLENLYFVRHSFDELQSLCPVLQRLSFRRFHHFDLSPTTWSSLKSVSLKYLHLDGETFEAFVAMNSQIIDLEISIGHRSWLEIISTHLYNLEALTFYERAHYFVEKEDIRSLKKLTKLKKLSLPSKQKGMMSTIGFTRPDEYGLSRFVRYLTKFTELREIKFNDNFYHSERLSNNVFEKIAVRLPHLEVFHFPYFSPAPQAIIGFVRFAKCLKEVYIGLENNEFDDDEWMYEFIIARKSNQPKDAAPLIFLIEAECSIGLGIKKKFLQRSDFGKFVCVKAWPKES